MPTAVDSYNLETGQAGLVGSCANPLPWQMDDYETGGPFIPPCANGPNPLNLAPVVSISAPQSALPGATFTLTGSVLDDGLPSDGVLTLIWTQVSGPVATVNSPASAVTTAALPTAGTYVFKLSATDGQLAASATKQIIGTSNLPPVVTVGANQSVVLPSTISITGTVTDDGVPGTGLTHVWSQVSGPSATIANPAAFTTQVSTTQVGTAVFRLTGSDGQLSSFADTSVATRYRVGTNPWSIPLQATDSKLYGPTLNGGYDGSGGIYGMPTSGAPIGLHNFVAGEGINPVCSLIQATDGNFYGLTTTTLFRLTSTGIYTVLHTFADGEIQTQRGLYAEASTAGIMQANDGNIYGGTYFGGTSGYGQIFKFTLSGSFSVLHSLNGTEGSYVTGTPIQGADGALYVPARQGNAGAYGAVLRVTLAGMATVLYSFDNTGTNGALEPINSLVLAADGNFYGVTNSAKIGNNGGVIYRLTPSGTFTPLYAFGGINSGVATSALIQATDGNFYGARYDFGSLNVGGAIYKLTPTGTYSVLHGFSGSDGNTPIGVKQATDGFLYGVTRQGGSSGNGTLFKLSVGGAFTSIYNFPDGQ